MNRNEEYLKLLEALDKPPETLETTLERAVAREKTSQQKWREFGIPAGSFAACFLGFVLLVNLFPPFAQACENIPVLGALAEAVSWSPSLSAAVENEYVQPIGKSQTVNGITATIDSVIVDQKQVNIFFTLEGDYENLSAEMPEFTPEQVCSTQSADYRQPPGALLHFTLDYFENDVPDRLTITFGVTTWVEQDAYEVPDRDYKDEMLDRPEEPEPDILAEFTFDLEFDPTFTAKGERIPVNQTFTMDGQSVTITEAEIYPTHARINVAADADNTAWLMDLGFHLENEDGERFGGITNGVSATGDPDSPANISYHFESSYFDTSEHWTLWITGATWLDKGFETVRVDLESKTADRLPQGVRFTKAEHRDGGWYLEFEAKQFEENRNHQLFYMTFLDKEGNKYEMGSMGTTSDDANGIMEVNIPLPDYHGSEVWLEPCYSHVTVEEEPISISIK